MNLNKLFKRNEKKNQLVKDNVEEPINIKINSPIWEDTAKNLRGEYVPAIDSMFFQKMGFKDDDKIQIFTAKVSNDIYVKVPHWSRNGKNLPKIFFKIVSEQRGEFILGVCAPSATLISNDLTFEKQYEFRFSKLDSAILLSEKNVVCNSDIKLETLYKYNGFSIICDDVKENKKSIKLKFSLAQDTFSYFEDSEITEERITKAKEDNAAIRRNLLELKEIPTNENNDGIIKLFNEIYLNNFFDKNIVLKEIVLTTDGREDTVKFEDKRVKSYQINDLVRGTNKISSNEYNKVSEPSYPIETSKNGTNIKLSEVAKEKWLNDSEQCLLDIIPASINEQKYMEDLLTKVDDVVVKSLRLKK